MSELIVEMINYDASHDGMQIEEEVRSLQEDAEKAEYLYHCTTADNVIKILQSRQIWMTSLSNPTLNDPEEVRRISNPEYRDKVFVSCFSKSPVISAEHWDEYGHSECSIVFRFKREWMSGRFVAIPPERVEILSSINEIEKSYKNHQERIGKLYAHAVGFYSIKYDDLAIQQSVALPLRGSFLHPNATGLVKPRQGLSRRTNIERIWENEQEIRYRVILELYPFADTINLPRIAALLTDNAFSTFEFIFSPDFPKQQKQNFLDELNSVNPDMIVHELNLK